MLFLPVVHSSVHIYSSVALVCLLKNIDFVMLSPFLSVLHLTKRKKHYLLRFFLVQSDAP